MAETMSEPVSEPVSEPIMTAGSGAWLAAGSRPRDEMLLQAALRPARPGPAVRALGSVLPGVRRTGAQIQRYADGWRADALAALASDRPAVTVLGDSLAQGIGAGDRSLGYACLVAARLGHHLGRELSIINLSRSGARIDDVLRTQIPANRVAEGRGTPIIGGVCTVGSNDLIRSTRLGAAKRRMTELVDNLPEGMVIATVPDRGSQVAKRLNRHLRMEAERVGRPVADVAGALDSWKGRLAKDRFHPNDAGHRLWAEVITAAVLEQLQGSNRAPGRLRPHHPDTDG